jgi:hypothetical protein
MQAPCQPSQRSQDVDPAAFFGAVAVWTASATGGRTAARTSGRPPPADRHCDILQLRIIRNNFAATVRSLRMRQPKIADESELATVLGACLYLLGQRQRRPCPGNRRALAEHLRWVALCDEAPAVLRNACALLLGEQEAELDSVAELLGVAPPMTAHPRSTMH